MNVDKTQLTTILQAIRSRNIDVFRTTIQRGFDVNTFIRSKKACNSMPLVEKVARSRFSNGLRVLFTNSTPCKVNRDDAVQAFHASIKSGAPRTVINVFVEISIAGILPVLSLADSYRYAIEYHCSRLARQVVDTQGFDANCCVQLFAGTWERPLHSAVKRNQSETAARLIQLGAEVDAPNCYGITPLMMACGKISIDCCRLLIANGADPNSYTGIRARAWPLGATEFLGSVFNKPKIPSYPNFTTTLRRWRLTNKADRIIALLIHAGLRPQRGNWLQRTAVVVHMSTEAGRSLKELVFRLPTLMELAVVQGRQLLRRMRTGPGAPGFNDLVDNLHIPYIMKQQLKIELVA